MLRARSTRFPRAAVGLVASCLAMLLLTTATAFGQVSTTATVRGTVEDSSGGVLPGATVTITNTGTKAVQTVVTDDRGQYQFGALFPGTYDLKVELSGFKTYEQKSLGLNPNDTRGIDLKLEVGAQTETITVTAQQEVHADGDGRSRRRSYDEADRQPVDHGPQRTRTAAHHARRRHRLQHR